MTVAALAHPHHLGLDEIAAGFAPADPELAMRRELLRRTDTKFLLERSALARVLEQVTGDYGVLLAGDRSLSSYRTLYFDTADLEMFHDHRRGRRPRRKVRIRHYDDRQLSFVEVKTKRSEALSVKHRREIAYGSDELDLDLVAARGRLDPARLRPALWTNFERLTLIGLATPERVTVDLDLRFIRGEHRLDLGGVAILEVKQAPFSARTPIWRALRSLGMRPRSVSKYCAGTLMTRRGLRYNRLAPSIRAINELAR